MRTMIVALVAAGALVGCNNPDRDVIEQSKDATQDQLNAQKQAADQAADAARERVDAQNKAEKARITAEEKAQKAQIEAEKEKVDAQAKAQKEAVDAAQGAPGVVNSGTATDQTFVGRVTSLNKETGTVTVADANGSQEFKLSDQEKLSDLKPGDTVSVKFHHQNGANIADTVDVNRLQSSDGK